MEGFETKTCLAVSHLDKRYGTRQVLRDITFSLNDGEILGIIGPNGAGKTTLFNIITGWVPPSRGDLVFWGKQITGWPPDRLCREGDDA